MAPKKKRTAAKPRRPNKALEEAVRELGVRLEDVQSQMRLVFEAVTSLGQQFDAKLSAVEARLSERISVLESVVRQNSEDIRKNSEDIRKNSEDIRKNSEDIRQLQEEVAQLRRDFDRRAELARVDALEQRVAQVEAKLGIAS
jgi:hypothetical protein